MLLCIYSKRKERYLKMARENYIWDFYFIPTILFHIEGGTHYTIRLVWLEWYVDFCWIKEESEG
jgi:hypothetical protein